MPGQELPKTGSLQEAIKAARSWLNMNGRPKSKAEVYDEYDQRLIFRAELDASGKVVTLIYRPPRRRRSRRF
jgi:hypothetical protein